MDLGLCSTEGCELPAKIIVTFQSGGITGWGPPVEHPNRLVTRAWCIPDFMDWSFHLRSVQREGIGY
jgi:hypothetical protein